jgi:hypothetical protein
MLSVMSELCCWRHHCALFARIDQLQAVLPYYMLEIDCASLGKCKQPLLTLYVASSSIKSGRYEIITYAMQLPYYKNQFC